MLERGRCIDFIKPTVANVLVTITLDTLMIVMPIYEVAKLHSSVPQEIGVALVFGTGVA